MQPGNRPDTGDSPAPKRAVVPPRHAPYAGFLRFALKNRDSEAAKSLKLQNHSLSESQITELELRIAAVTKNSRGLFNGLWDTLATAVECTIGLFTGNCDFGDFTRLKAGRAALRTASAIYEDLAKPGPSGLSPYGNLAERISGVRPDGNGGYRPILDEQNRATGFFRENFDKKRDPKTAFFSSMEDRGFIPSPAQRARSEAIYQEEAAALYRDEAVQIVAARYKPNPLKPGKDLESEHFVNDLVIMKRVEAIADLMLADETLKKSGSFQYDAGKQRDSLIGQIKWRLAGEHKSRAVNIQNPYLLNTPNNQIGQLNAPIFGQPGSGAAQSSRG